MAKVKYENMRSCWEFGEASECRRGLMCGMGYTEEEQKRPLIAVVNSWNEYNPGHVHLDKLAERVKQGVREAGGLPLEVMTTGICDGMVLKDPRYIEVPSRNSIADQVELTVDGNFFDGMVLLSSCDSVVPGHLMGAARLNIPAIMVTGGYMPLGTFRGKEVLHIHAQDKAGNACRVHVHGDFGVLGEFRAVQAKAGERRVQLIARINFPRTGGNKRLIDAPDIVFQHLNRRIPGQILPGGRCIPVNIAKCPRDRAHEHRHQHQQRRAAQGFAHAHFFASSIACRSSTKRAMSSAVPSTPSLPVSTHRS